MKRRKRSIPDDVIVFWGWCGFMVLDFTTVIIADILDIHWLSTLAVIVGATVMTLTTALGFWAFLTL